MTTPANQLARLVVKSRTGALSGQAIEGDKLFLRLGIGDEGADEPKDGGDEGGEQSGLCGDDGAVAHKCHMGKDEGDGSGTDGGDDFTPCIDAPPIPTKNKDGSCTGTDTQHDLPTFRNRSELTGDVASREDKHDGEDFAHVHVVPFGGGTNQESAIEIVDKIRCAPIELRANGRHEGGEEGRDHQAAQRGGKKIAQHHDVPLLRIGGEIGAWLHAAVGRVEREGDKCRNDPRPRPECVMGDVEPDGGAE